MKDHTNTNEFLQDYMNKERRAQELGFVPVDSNPSNVAKWILILLVITLGLLCLYLGDERLYLQP